MKLPTVFYKYAGNTEAAATMSRVQTNGLSVADPFELSCRRYKSLILTHCVRIVVVVAVVAVVTVSQLQ